MKQPYPVVIICNPNSTGPSEANAHELYDALRKKYSGEVRMRRTSHPGHAETMARAYAKKDQPMILISSSGDGGYHELINGILLQGSKHVIAGLLPSGNANDHHSEVANGTLIEDILKADFRCIDTLKITATVGGKPWVRYAHSYAGIGISPIVASDLTTARPNLLSEKWLVIKSLFSFEYVKIRIKGQTRRYSSLIFSNIGKMSKVLKVAPGASTNDGRFEVNAIRFRSKFALAGRLFRASTIGLKDTVSTTRYEFVTTRRTLIQLDGEVYKLDANIKVVVESAPESLRCVV